MSPSDLNEIEQTNVRTALKFLHFRFGEWEALARVLKYQRKTMINIASGDVVTPTLAFRIARLVCVPLEDVLTGAFPSPGSCAYCGRDPKGERIKLAAE